MGTNDRSMQELVIEQYHIKRKPSLGNGNANDIFSSARDIAAWLGVDPFAVLLHFANNDYVSLGYNETDISPGLRFRAAAEAVKYLHPTVKAVALFDGGDSAQEAKQKLVESLMDALDDEAESIATNIVSA